MLVAVMVVAGSGAAPRLPAAAAPPPVTYRPPVTAPVRDPFRAPPEPWLAGNRGIEYATAAGTPVRAIGPGVVTFAGTVAGEHDVTVTHPDGLRSSYVDLAVLRVVRGDRVDAGQGVGVSTDRLHLGVRRGDTYLDPASLWGRRVGGGRVVLVPLDDRPRASPQGGPRPGPGPGNRHPRRAAPPLPLGRTLHDASAMLAAVVLAAATAVHD